MNGRSASAIVGDDLTVSLNGKYNLVGIYPSEIVIPADESSLAQLVFLIQFCGSMANPFTKFEVEVTLPGEEPMLNALPVPPAEFMANTFDPKGDWIVLVPFAMRGLTLRPGHIRGIVRHDLGETILQLPRIRRAGK